MLRQERRGAEMRVLVVLFTSRVALRGRLSVARKPRWKTLLSDRHRELCEMFSDSVVFLQSVGVSQEFFHSRRKANAFSPEIFPQNSRFGEKCVETRDYPSAICSASARWCENCNS